MAIDVTESLCVYEEQRDYTLNLMRNISGYAVGRKIPVLISLEHCPSITAGALLILFAEVSRARIVAEDDNIVKIKLPTKGSLKDTLDHIGWTKAITISFRDYPSLMEENCPFQTASKPHEAMASIFNLLSSSGVTLTSPESKVFTKGVNEAILNVFNHAYSHEDYPLDGIGRRWWQACWRADDNSFVYIIFDLGQGITNSLPKAYDNEPIDEHICRAMRLGVTCTGDSKRGKGSENIKDATDIKDESTLFIGSRNALYTKLSGETPLAGKCILPFNGTLAEWQINVGE
ncbi:hypothetical protein HJ118_07090 [Vibrio parahaemolyticus]|nr:hypothetical protein [Vibrio parahaemolyticus]MBE4063683.1 hypothetical protein [Vibrio parahaemolyticus]MBE4315941.1 hypothetical protein [Vibrio parahaemolyticus]OKY49215.1 hypothetical protein BT101_00175 [Vibrio parahaemolyticus]OUD69938.1 hypothetical protein BTN34_13600 [Vibrio parahaemolyticus]